MTCFAAEKQEKDRSIPELIQVDGGMLQLVVHQKMDQQEEWRDINIMLLQMVVILMLEVDLELITLLLESLRMDRLLMYLSCKMQALDLGYMQGVLMP